MNAWFGTGARRALALVCVVVVCASAAACGSSESDSSADSGELATLRLQNCIAVLQVAIAPLVVGEQLGFLEEEGIGKVEVANSSGSTAQCVQLTAGGKADFTSPVPDLLFNSAAKGVNPGVRCTYNLIRRPTMAFMVDPDSGYDSFGDLNGTTIGVHDLASAYIPLFEASMKAQGGDPSTVEYQVTGFGAQVVDALKTGKVDGALYWDYEAAGYPAFGYTPKLLTPPDNVNRLFSSCIAFNENFIEDKPDLVAGYLRALSKSLIFAEENPEATVKLFWRIAPETKPTDMSDAEALEQAKAVLESRLANNIPEPSEPDPRWGAWAGEQQWKEFADFLGVGDKVDVSELYTTEFIDQANDFDADKVREFARNYKVKD